MNTAMPYWQMMNLEKQGGWLQLRGRKRGEAAERRPGGATAAMESYWWGAVIWHLAGLYNNSLLAHMLHVPNPHKSNLWEKELSGTQVSHEAHTETFFLAHSCLTRTALLPQLLFQTQRLGEKKNQPNCFIIMQLNFYFRCGRLLSQWNGGCISVICKVTVILTGKLQLQHMTEGTSNTSSWKIMLFQSCKFPCWSFKDHFTSCSFIIKPKPRLIYLIKHPQNSAEDEVVVCFSRSARFNPMMEGIFPGTGIAPRCTEAKGKTPADCNGASLSTFWETCWLPLSSSYTFSEVLTGGWGFPREEGGDEGGMASTYGCFWGRICCYLTPRKIKGHQKVTGQTNWHAALLHRQ